MHRIDSDGAAPGGLYTNGDPMTSTPATVSDAAAMNAVQEELCNVVTDGGGPALVKGTNNQVITRLKALFGRLSVANAWALVQAFTQGFTVAGSTYKFDLNGDVVARDVGGRNVTASGTAAVTGAITGGANATVVGDFAYSTPKALYTYVDPADFQPGTAANMSLVTSTSSAAVTVSGATPVAVRARVRVPGGATITGLDIMASNSSGGSLAITVIALTVIEDVFGSGSPTYTNYVTAPTQTLGASSAKSWRNVAVSAMPALPSRSWVTLDFLLPSNSSLQVFGARMSYTLPAVAPV